jgi:hypothetical protein
MINFADKAKNPSFGTAKTVSTLIANVASAHWLTVGVFSRS